MSNKIIDYMTKIVNPRLKKKSRSIYWIFFLSFLSSPQTGYFSRAWLPPIITLHLQKHSRLLLVELFVCGGGRGHVGVPKYCLILRFHLVVCNINIALGNNNNNPWLYVLHTLIMLTKIKQK